MKRLSPVPSDFAEQLRRAGETGIGYQVVAVELKDGRKFEQVATSEGFFIAVRGHQEIPFSSDEVASLQVNHKRWNFRGGSDSRVKVRKAAA